MDRRRTAVHSRCALVRHARNVDKYALARACFNHLCCLGRRCEREAVSLVLGCAGSARRGGTAARLCPPNAAGLTR
eukprot:290016-Pleurochrysis_carterae.AAC.6